MVTARDAGDAVDVSDAILPMTARRFRDTFGMEPDAVAHIYNTFVDDSTKMQDILMFLHYIKCYPLVEVGAAIWRVHYQTYLKRIWSVGDQLFDTLYPEYVDFKQRLDHPELKADGLFGRCHTIVDGTVCRINRPTNTPIRLQHISGKHHFFCLKYEVAVNIATGHIVWVYGPRGGAVHDMKVLREGGILDEIRPGERILADKGYIDAKLSHIIITPVKRGRGEREEDLSLEAQNRNHRIQHVRALVEHSIGRMKRFSILSHQFRGDLDDHQMYFKVCAALTNLYFDYNPIRKQPHRYLM